MTSGHINLRKLMYLTNITTVMRYIVGEVQDIYSSQGQNINDKHRNYCQTNAQRTHNRTHSQYLPGEVVNIIALENSNKNWSHIRKSRQLLNGCFGSLSRFMYRQLAVRSKFQAIRVLVEASGNAPH